VTNEELLKEKAELVPGRVLMRRHKNRRRGLHPRERGVGCLQVMGVYPPGSPCFMGDYENFD
jgi:hypothetical protein